MKLTPYIFLPLFLALSGQAPPQRQAAIHPPTQAHFTPGGSPTAAIVEALDNARETALIQAYSFTSEPIANALIQAHNRGVKVEVILDKSHKDARRASAPLLKKAGIPIWIDTKHAIAHNKVMIVDGYIVITGSFNFSRSAEERNAENLVIINDSRLAAEYIANWEKHKSHSEEYLS